MFNRVIAITKFLSVLAILTVVITSCEENTGRTVPYPKEWYVHKGSNYSFEYPASWEEYDADYNGVDIIILSPKEYTTDKFRENFNVVTQESQGMTLEEYTNFSVDQINNLFEDSHVLSITPKERDETQYMTVIFQGKQGLGEMKYRQDYTIIDGIAYVLTFTTDIDRFEDYQDLSEHIFTSFRINQ